jgi:hypothetical protein
MKVIRLLASTGVDAFIDYAFAGQTSDPDISCLQQS